VSPIASSRRYRIARSDRVGPASRVKQSRRLRRATIEASSRKRERERETDSQRRLGKRKEKRKMGKKIAMVVREQHRGTRCEFSLLVFQSPALGERLISVSLVPLFLSFSPRQRRKKERPRAISNGAAREFLSRKCIDRATGEDRR